MTTLKFVNLVFIIIAIWFIIIIIKLVLNILPYLVDIFILQQEF